MDRLKEYFEFDQEEEKRLKEVADRHPMNIPRYYLSLIDESDPQDPIRKLAFPSEEELTISGSMGETTKDP